MDHLALRFGRRLSSKRRPAREHFIENGTGERRMSVAGPMRSRFYRSPARGAI